MNLTETKALAGIAEAALAGPTGATENAVVTLEYPEASTAVVAGTPVILIDPPTLSFDTWHVRTATYTVWIIAASRDLTTAWAQLDTLLDAVANPLNATAATPGEFRPHQGQPTPAYRLDLAPVEYERT